MRKIILRILFVVAIIGSTGFLVNYATAEEPLSSIEGPTSVATPEEIDPNAVALLIQDVDPWRGGNNHTALHYMGILHDVRNSSSLGQITEKDLQKYKFVMYASAQPSSYYINLRDNLEKISNFVEKGGLLIAHSCDGGWDGTGDWRGFSILPGGVTHLMGRDNQKYSAQSIHILDPEHSVVKSMFSDFVDVTLTDEYFRGWNWSTHGIFTNFLDNPKIKNPTVVMESNEGDGGDGPTYIDYNYGLGKVLATMQTVEWGYFNGTWWMVGIGNRPELLRNELRFAKRISPMGAKELAKEVIGKDYKWGEKGYKRIDKNFQFFNSTDVRKLDCSGLSFWSYNRAYYGDREIEPSYAIWEETPREKWKENLWEIKLENRPVYYFGANGQWEGNVKPIEKAEIKSGDLFFFNTDADSEMDHVAIYIGPFQYEGKEYNTIHATQHPLEKPLINEIIVANYDIETEKLTTIKFVEGEEIKQVLEVDGYGRVTDHIVDMKIVGGSPIDLIITDPDGITLTKEIEDIPGMEYMEYDLNGDDKLDDIIASPERKVGDYLIQVVPEPDALPTDTYTLTIEALVNGVTVTTVLAENVPVSKIPEQPYQIQSTETEINAFPVANANGPYEDYVSFPVIFDASGSYDPEGKPLKYRWDFNSDGAWDTDWLNQATTTYAYWNSFEGLVTLEVSDGVLIASDTAKITIKGAKDLKQGAIKELETAKTGNKKIDKKIDSIIGFIKKSLDKDLWIDASRLVFFKKDSCFDPEILEFNPDQIDLEGIFDLEPGKVELKMKDVFQGKCFGPKLGITVFYNEKNAIRLLTVDQKQIPDEIKLIFKEVIAKLIKADTILAKVSLYDARNTPIKNPRFKKIVEHQIIKAEKELIKAEQELSRNRPDKVISRLAKSWLHSQLAIKFVGLDFNSKFLENI